MCSRSLEVKKESGLKLNRTQASEGNVLYVVYFKVKLAVTGGGGIGKSGRLCQPNLLLVRIIIQSYLLTYLLIFSLLCTKHYQLIQTVARFLCDSCVSCFLFVSVGRQFLSAT